MNPSEPVRTRAAAHEADDPLRASVVVRALVVLLVLLLAAPLAASQGPMAITAIAPSALAAGTAVPVHGRVTLSFAGLAGQVVDLEKDGVLLATVLTDPNGNYAVNVPGSPRGAHAIVAIVGRGLGPAESRSLPVLVQWASPPSAPRAPTVTPGATAHEATVSWTAPADDGGAPMTQARTERATSLTGAWTTVATTTQRGAAISGLAFDTTYHLRVSEANVAGFGPASATVSFHTPPPAVAQAPTITSIGFVDDPPRIELSWAPPADMGNGALVRYEVMYGPDRAHDVAVESWRVGLGSASFPIGYGQATEVYVRAITTAGTGLASGVAPIETPHRDGLRATIDDITVIQKWPLHERWIYAAEGGTTQVYGNLTILLGTRGDLYDADVAQTNAPLTLDQTVSWTGGSSTGTLAFRTDRWGQFYDAVFLDVPALAAGQCVAYDGTSLATAGADTASDTASFTLCGADEPPA